jgi:hypothetical protein
LPQSSSLRPLILLECGTFSPPTVLHTYQPPPPTATIFSVFIICWCTFPNSTQASHGGFEGLRTISSDRPLYRRRPSIARSRQLQVQTKSDAPGIICTHFHSTFKCSEKARVLTRLSARSSMPILAMKWSPSPPSQQQQRNPPPHILEPLHVPLILSRDGACFAGSGGM